MDRERAVERDEAFRSSQIQYARWLENLRENPIHLRRGQILNDCGLDLARIAGIMNTCAAMCLARFARSRIAISRWYHLRAAGGPSHWNLCLRRSRPRMACPATQGT